MQLNAILDLLTRGSLSFSGYISGSGISDLLLGFPSFGMQAQSNNPITLRSSAYAAFFQDEWKIRSNFTLNLGVRYEYNTPPVDPTNRMSTFNLQTGSLVQVGTNGTSRSGINPDGNNFAPRIGFAWNPMRDFVVRGGYGLYYDASYFEVNSALYYNPPQFTLQVFFPSRFSLLNGGQTGFDRPNLLHDPNISNPTRDRWFDTNAFAGASPYHFGNAGRNILRGPGFASFDFSLARTFTPSDKTTLQFEAQAFNLFNRVNFDLPELYADEPGTFGKIFAARSPRQLQFALRLSF